MFRNFWLSSRITKVLQDVQNLNRFDSWSRWTIVAIALLLPWILYGVVHIPIGSALVHEWLPSGRPELTGYHSAILASRRLRIPWRSATTQGALASIALGVSVWLVLTLAPAFGETFPSPLGGLLAAILGMLMGSKLPQWIPHSPASEEKTYKVHPEHLGHQG